MSYIIRNCPCYDSGFCTSRRIYVQGCSQCTDCKLKQIAIMCNYAIHGAKATGHFNFLGEKILKLLDIQEITDEPE